MENRFIPKRRKLYNVACSLKQLLFADAKWRLDHDAMVTLLDSMSRDPRAPHPYSMPYGQAVEAVNNTRKSLYHMGTGGSNLQLQSKQSITCARMKFDENRNVRNKSLLDSTLPHKKDN